MKLIGSHLLNILGKHQSSRILDIGCGNGALAGLLHASGYEVVGVDADSSGIDIARKAFPGVEFHQVLIGGASTRFVSDVQGTFDTIIATDVIEHLYRPSDLIDYASRLLSANGRIVIGTPYHGYFKNLALSFVNGWDRHWSPNWDGGHIKFFSRRTLTELFYKQGYVMNEFVGAGRAPFLWHSMLLVFERSPK